MVFGALLLAYVILRWFWDRRGGTGFETGSQYKSPATGLIGLFRLAMSSPLVVAAIEVPSPPTLCALVLLLLPGAPIALVTALGLPVLPFLLTRVLRPWTAGKENVAAAVFHELRARLRFGLLLSPKRVENLADRLFSLGDLPRARGYTLAARGIIDALQGNLDQARALFNLTLDFRHSAYAVRRYCHAWLLADAAERGRWTDVLRLSKRGPFSMRRLLFRSCAEQLLCLRSHSRLRLRVLWLASPGRRQTWAVVQACEQVRAVDLPPLGRDFRAAFDGAARLVAAPPGSMSGLEIDAIAELWQSALDDGSLRQHLIARMKEQGSGFDVEQALARVEQQVVAIVADSLAQAASWSEKPERERSLILIAAEARLQNELMEELEALSARLEIDEDAWDADLERLVRRWAEIRSVAQRYLDLFPASRELLYDNFGSVFCGHAIWLHIRITAYPLACDIFRWLSASVPANHAELDTLRSNERLAYDAASRQ